MELAKQTVRIALGMALGLLINVLLQAQVQRHGWGPALTVEPGQTGSTVLTVALVALGAVLLTGLSPRVKKLLLVGLIGAAVLGGLAITASVLLLTHGDEISSFSSRLLLGLVVLAAGWAWANSSGQSNDNDEEDQ